jgi:general stress protein 26
MLGTLARSPGRMTEREWRFLMEGSNVPKMVYRSRTGFPTPQPVWCLRDGDDLITVTWSKTPLVESIERGESVQVWVDLEDGHVTAAYEGDAVVVDDPTEVEIWSQWIWRHFRGATKAALSPSRCDVLVRFTPVHCSESSAEQAQQLRHGFSDDTGQTLQAKLLYNLNDLLQNLYLSTLTNLDSVHLIRSSDLSQELPAMDVFRVPAAKLLAREALGDFLEALMENAPEWINVRVYLDNGIPQLLAFSAQNPSRSASREIDPRVGAKFMMSWRGDTKVALV